MAEAKVQLGYWAIRGLASPARLILAAGGVPWDDVLYRVKQREDGGWDRSEWLDVKHTLGAHPFRSPDAL